jgi:RNA polymerase sigma-70 factor (ECF subfamily)
MTEIPASPPPEKFMDIAIGDMIKMMDEMPDEYCEALCLTELEGLSQKEYADKKGLSYSGAKSRVQRARLILKNMLLQCCHYQFDKYGTAIDIQPKCCCCCSPEHNI